MQNTRTFSARCRGQLSKDRQDVRLTARAAERGQARLVQVANHEAGAGFERFPGGHGQPPDKAPDPRFLDHAGQPPGRIPQRPLGALLGDAQRLQGTAIQVRGVVGRLEEHGVGGRDAVELVARQRAGIVGKLIHRPSAQVVDPLARRRRLDAGAQQLERRLPGADAVPPHFLLPGGRGAHQVHVVVDEPRDHGAAAEIDAARRRARQADDLAVAADAQDAVALDRHGLRDREAIVHRDHLAVGQDDVGAARARGRRFLRGKPRGRASRDEERCRRDASPVHRAPTLRTGERGYRNSSRSCRSARRASRRRRRDLAASETLGRGSISLRRCRRHPRRDLLRRKGVADVEDAHAGVVVGGENRLLAAEAARPVLVQVVRAEGADGAEVAILRRRQRWRWSPASPASAYPRFGCRTCPSRTSRHWPRRQPRSGCARAAAAPYGCRPDTGATS